MTNRQLKAARYAFLDDMLSFYSVDPVGRRGKGDYTINGRVTSGCVYRSSDGRKCSIGRYIPDDKYTPDMEGNAVDYQIIFSALPDEIQALGESFLKTLQGIHDVDYYWHVNGITESGEHAVSVFIERYMNTIPDDDNEVEVQA